MSRPRQNGRNVPPGVYFNKGRWFLRADGRETRLAGANAPSKEVWDAYLVLRKIEPPESFTLERLCDEYLASPQLAKLAPATQRDYETCKKVVCTTPLKDGTPFGRVVAAAIDPPAIARYRDKRA